MTNSYKKNVRSFADINGSQGSVATQWGIFNKYFAANLLDNLTMRTWWKSVENEQSYRHEFGVSLFGPRRITEHWPILLIFRYEKFPCSWRQAEG